MRLSLFFGFCAVLFTNIDHTDAQLANSVVGYRAACTTYNRLVSATPAVLCSYCAKFKTSTVGQIRCTSSNPLNTCYADYEGIPEQFAAGETKIPTLTNIGTSGVVVPCSRALGVGSTLTGPLIIASSLGSDLPAFSFTLVNSSVARLLNTAAFPSPIAFNVGTGQLQLTGTDPGVDVTYTYAVTLIDRNNGAVSAPIFLTVKFQTCRLNVACTPNQITVCNSAGVAGVGGVPYDGVTPYTGFSCKVTNQNFPFALTALSWDFNNGVTDLAAGGLGLRTPFVVTSSDNNITPGANSILSTLGGGLYGVGFATPTPGTVLTQTDLITVDDPTGTFATGTTQITVSTFSAAMDPAGTCSTMAVASFNGG